MRYVYAGIGLIVIVGGLAGVKFTQIKSLIDMGEAFAKAGPPPEVVSTGVATEDTWEDRISAVGTIATARGVTVANDAAGVVSAIRFESGQAVKKGQVLVELDSSVERAQLASTIARRDLARVSAGRSRALVQQNAIPEAQLDADAAAYKSATADVAALQAQIDRKVIRAPFDGRLGIRQVNLGQYLNPGTAITVLQSSQALYADFTLPQSELANVAVGTVVRLNEHAAGPRATATIAAVDPELDPVTRAIKLRASVDGADHGLRPGMFVNVSVVLPEKRRVVRVPATAVVRASFGDSVFVNENGQARQTFVKLGEARGDFVAIVEGIKPGQEVVTSGAFKLRNGAKLAVNNAVKLEPSLEPRPENR
jgi:membrane fusion protein (multidrug efflux system)